MIARFVGGPLNEQEWVIERAVSVITLPLLSMNAYHRYEMVTRPDHIGLFRYTGIAPNVISPLPIERFVPTEAWEFRDAHSMTFQNMTEEAEKEMAEWRGIIDGGRKGRK